ncbi:MAG: peptidyl-prolyl cis-trans isomerase [Pseudomonadota bacterium]|nr:peptidyl-prolyl cis-trans isomerase [Pseudomonadota bacterium]
MLEALRNSSNSNFFKAFLIILALSFVAWGASDFFTGANNTTAVEVNGEGISVYDVNRQFRDRVQALEKQYRRKLEPQLISAAGIDRQVLESLITDTLITGAASDLDLRVSNQQLHNSIVNTGAFNGENGEFDATVYKNLVRAQGYTTESFEAQIRKDLTKSLMSGAFLNLPVSEQTAAQLAKTGLESLDLSVFYINTADIKDVDVPTEDAQREYYNKYTASFVVPEMRSADVITLSYDMLAEGIDIPEEELVAYYEANKTDFTTEEERKARHILVSDYVEAEKLYQQLKDGSDFAELATEFSNDPISKAKGGDLGFFKRDDMVAEFADAAFSLETGMVSEPVETPFGFHLIEVTEVKAPAIPALADVREEIIAMMSEDKAANAFDNALNEIDAMVLEGQSVAAIAEALNLEVTKVDSITQAERELAAVVRDEIFNLNNGDVSDPITDESVLHVVHVTAVTPSRTKSFEESQIDIIDTLQDEARTEKLLRTTNKALSDLKAGKTFAQVERELNLTKPLDTVMGVTRSRTNAPQWVNAAALLKLFSLDANEFYATPVATPTGYALLKLNAKNTPNPTASQVEAMQQQLSASLRQDLEFQYIVKKRAEASVKPNGNLLRQVFGPDFRLNAL